MVYNFYHITDVHYYSKRNFKCDWRTFPQPSTQICILKSEEAFRKALEIISEDEDTSTVIITGDLTNHGEAYSHEEVRDILQEFTDKGGNPFVYTDNHDYPYFPIHGFGENGEKIPMEHLPEDEVKKMYYPFGRDKAFDTYDDGTTYIAEILPGLYHIAMGYDAEDQETLHYPYFSDELMEQLKKVRRSGLTFAPEAGTQRLRDAINKNVTEEEVLSTALKAFDGGWTSVKLYFMMGLPTETLDDIKGIADLAQKVVDTFYHNPNKPKGKGVQVSVSCASFVPKPFTPFQWEPQDTAESLIEKQKHLLSSTISRKITISYHQSDTSVLEGVLARGDRRLGEVIYKAWQKGCKFDSWDEFFDFNKWREAFNECELTTEFYANRRRDYDEILPWDIMDYGIRKEFLVEENKKAHESVTTPHCRIKCSACGANKLNGGKCDARS